MKYLTVDVGGTEIKYAVMDEELNVYDRGYVPTPMDTFDHFAEEIEKMYDKCKDEVEGIAMSLPGIIDVKKGLVIGGGALLYNHGTYVGKLLEERLGCRVVLENDGKAAALAEYHKGALQGTQNSSVFIIGTGVGGGLIINGQIVRGRDFSAGEYSFLSTNADKIDDFTTYVGSTCSTRGLLERYRTFSGSDEQIDGREFFRRLPDDEAAKKALDDFALAVAKQVYNLYWLLDLEKIAIGGGISRQPILTEKIREKFAEVCATSAMGKYMDHASIEIVTCQFQNDANLIGAMMNFISETRG